MTTETPAPYFGITSAKDHAKGVEVEGVEANSPAAIAGVQVGDVIARFANQPTKVIGDLQALVRATPVGVATRINLFRAGQKVTLEVTLQAKAPAKKKKLSLDVGDVSEVLERKISPA